MATWNRDTPAEMRKRELAAAHEAQKNWTPGQRKRVSFIGCFLFLVVAGCVGALVVFFINNPNGIPR